MNFRGIKKAALQQGWRVEPTKGGHWSFLSPDKTQSPVVASGTPSDRRSMNNLLAQLKQRGFIWPWPPTKGRK